MTDIKEAFWASPDGVRLRIRLTPNASRDAIGTIVETPDGAAMSARVTVAPEDGRANEALRKLLAKELRIAKSNIELIAGPKSRVKTFKIDGDAEKLIQTFRRLSSGKADG